MHTHCWDPDTRSVMSLQVTTSHNYEKYSVQRNVRAIENSFPRKWKVRVMILGPIVFTWPTPLLPTIFWYPCVILFIRPIWRFCPGSSRVWEQTSRDRRQNGFKNRILDEGFSEWRLLCSFGAFSRFLLLAFPAFLLRKWVLVDCMVAHKELFFVSRAVVRERLRRSNASTLEPNQHV